MNNLTDACRDFLEHTQGMQPEMTAMLMVDFIEHIQAGETPRMAMVLLRQGQAPMDTSTGDG